jgi:hypothetical protein
MKENKNMNDNIVNSLFEATNEFLLPLRMGEGFDQKKYENLCDILRLCRDEWLNSEYVPKLAVEIMVDFYPLIEACTHIYKGKESERVFDAAVYVNNLAKDAVATTPWIEETNRGD